MSDPWEHLHLDAQAATVVELSKPFITTQHEDQRSTLMTDAPAPTAKPFSPTKIGPNLPQSDLPTADTQPDHMDAAEVVRKLFTNSNSDTFVVMANCINTYNFAKARLSTSNYCAEDARRLLDMIIIALDVPNVDQYRK